MDQKDCLRETLGAVFLAACFPSFASSSLPYAPIAHQPQDALLPLAVPLPPVLQCPLRTPRCKSDQVSEVADLILATYWLVSSCPTFPGTADASSGRAEAIGDLCLTAVSTGNPRSRGLVTVEVAMGSGVGDPVEEGRPSGREGALTQVAKMASWRL